MLEIIEIEKLFPICNKNTILRLFEEKDITSVYVGWLNDPVVVQYSNQRFKKHSIDNCKEYFQNFASNDGVFISIFARDTKRMIGTMTIYVNPCHSVADMGVLLGDRNYWGKGLGKEIWESVMSLLLNEGKVRKVTGGALSCNDKMIKIFKGSDMQEDGVRRKQEIVDDESHDIVHFAKLQVCKT